VLSREEELTIAPARPAQTVRLRVGLQAGRLTALDLRVLVDAGAYPAGSESLLRAAAREALSLYSVPHLRFVGEAAFTHRPPTSPLRGQGVLASLFALESHLDLIANALDEDPLELRRRHLATHEHTLRVAEALGIPAPAGHFDATEAMAAGASEIGWSRRWQAGALSGTRRRGVGMALLRHAVVGERGAASLQLREDGSFNLFVGASAMGNGAEEAFAAAAAETLGVPVERVVPAAGDTDSAPLDPGPAAPTLYLTGRAVQAAAARVRSQILEAGARYLGADAQELAAENEQVRTRDGRAVGLAVLAAKAFGSAEPIAATAFQAADEAAPAGAAVFAEVEVDVETGEVRVLRLVTALEGGPRLDPRLAEAEVEGDALRSTGDALFEHMAFTEEGRAVFRSLRDYRIATAADAPKMRTLFVPLDAPQTPFGARPLGDVAATGPALAIVNAVAHAIGARVNELPLTPERVRKAAAPRSP
jgi:putative selenate reductase molybdopterin-binding subunit